MGERAHVSVRVCYSENPSHHHAAIPSPTGTLAVTPPRAASGAAAVTRRQGGERQGALTFFSSRSISFCSLFIWVIHWAASSGKPAGKSQAAR